MVKKQTLGGVSDIVDVADEGFDDFWGGWGGGGRLLRENEGADLLSQPGGGFIEVNPLHKHLVDLGARWGHEGTIL